MVRATLILITKIFYLNFIITRKSLFRGRSTRHPLDAWSGDLGHEDCCRTEWNPAHQRQRVDRPPEPDGGMDDWHRRGGAVRRLHPKGGRKD